MELSGKIIQVLEKQTGAGKNGTWEKQEYILETQGQYPKKVCFNIWGAKIAQFNIQNGEFVNLGIELESREYNGRWYTDVRAWKVERPGAQSMPAQNMSAPQNMASDPFASTEQMDDPFSAAGSDEGSDDLPF
jgi:hypothetical protein